MKSIDVSEEVFDELHLVFAKHKEYCFLSRKLRNEVSLSSDEDFNLYILSMLHYYNGSLNRMILSLKSDLNFK